MTIERKLGDSPARRRHLTVPIRGSSSSASEVRCCLWRPRLDQASSAQPSRPAPNLRILPTPEASRHPIWGPSLVGLHDHQVLADPAVYEALDRYGTGGADRSPRWSRCVSGRSGQPGYRERGASRTGMVWVPWQVVVIDVDAAIGRRRGAIQWSVGALFEVVGRAAYVLSDRIGAEQGPGWFVALGSEHP